MKFRVHSRLADPNSPHWNSAFPQSQHRWFMIFSEVYFTRGWQSVTDFSETFNIDLIHAPNATSQSYTTDHVNIMNPKYFITLKCTNFWQPIVSLEIPSIVRVSISFRKYMVFQTDPKTSSVNVYEVFELRYCRNWIKRYKHIIKVEMG